MTATKTRKEYTAGTRIGKLTITRRLSSVAFDTVCDCGRKHAIDTTRLTEACDVCAGVEPIFSIARGQRFGELEVIELLDGGLGAVVECSCGETETRLTTSIRQAVIHGVQQSCKLCKSESYVPTPQEIAEQCAIIREERLAAMRDAIADIELDDDKRRHL